MGEKQKTWILWGLLGLAFAAGLALALVRADLAYIVRPTIGVMMIAAGLFFIAPAVRTAALSRCDSTRSGTSSAPAA